MGFKISKLFISGGDRLPNFPYCEAYRYVNGNIQHPIGVETMVAKQAGNKTVKHENAKNGAHPPSDNAAAHNITRVDVPANGIVQLPAGVTPDEIKVEGKDLVIHLADGSEIVIVNGAQNVPTLDIGTTTELPAQNVIALLNIEGQPGVQP